MNKLRKKVTFTEMKETNRNWFTKEAMAFFNTKIESSVLKGNYFITSERMELDQDKRYTIRQYNLETKQVTTIGDFRAYTSLESAKQSVRRLQAQNDL